MPIIKKDLLEFILSGADMLRWNDHLRPIEFVEIDKQAHKMLIAWLLWQENSKDLDLEQKINLARYIIEGGIFDYCYRLIITDIKPPIFSQIRKNHKDYSALTKYVIDSLYPRFAYLKNLWANMRAWFAQDVALAQNPDFKIAEEQKLARAILRSAHIYASYWELQILAPFNNFDQEMPLIHREIRDELQVLSRQVAGVQSLLTDGNALANFAKFCAHLRFQIRWTQVARLPKTSVLGHIFIVSTYAYLFSSALNLCPVRLINNFFAGLCHDLPELLTRDIISPVKTAISGLKEFLHQYEQDAMQKRILEPLEQAGYGNISQNLRYYLGIEELDLLSDSEFKERVRINGKTQILASFNELDQNYNSNIFLGVDGHLVKACDNLAAFMETWISIKNGVNPPPLVEARDKLRQYFMEEEIDPASMHLEKLMQEFS